MKDKIIYVCSECGSQSPRWQGKCNVCGAWESFIEKKVTASSKKNEQRKKEFNQLVRLDSISSEAEYRIMTGNRELDRVLGGGIIPGSLVLVGGDPGIGKSTLMLQMCSGLGAYNPLYITGEEWLQQIKYRSQRLEGIPDNLLLLCETNIEEIDAVINSSDTGVIIVDSIQAVYSDKIDSSPGSIVQARVCRIINANCKKY